MSRCKEFVLAGSRPQGCVKLKLTPKQLKQVALKLSVAPLTETLKSQMSASQLTERRNKSTDKTRRTPPHRRSLSKLAAPNFGPPPRMPKWKFLEEPFEQKTPKFQCKAEAALTARAPSPPRPEHAARGSRKTQLHSDIEELDDRILKEIEFHDSVNATPLLPAPDLMTGYTQALQDVRRMRSELENLKSREASILALNSQLKDTISLQQRRNDRLRTSHAVL